VSVVCIAPQGTYPGYSACPFKQFENCWPLVSQEVNSGCAADRISVGNDTNHVRVYMYCGSAVVVLKKVLLRGQLEMLQFSRPQTDLVT